MGLVFLGIGLANKDKWKKRKTWADLPATDKKIKTTLIIILGILCLAGLVAYYIFSK